MQRNYEIIDGVVVQHARHGCIIAPGVLLAIRADVASRLQRVCAHLPRSAFEDLVDRICRVRVRYEARRD